MVFVIVEEDEGFKLSFDSWIDWLSSNNFHPLMLLVWSKYLLRYQCEGTCSRPVLAAGDNSTIGCFMKMNSTLLSSSNHFILDLFVRIIVPLLI